MPKRSRKPPEEDYQQIARRVLDTADPSAEPDRPSVVRAANLPEKQKDPAAVALGRKGGLKGGKARAAKMTKKERSESAKKAAQARWARATESKS